MGIRVLNSKLERKIEIETIINYILENSDKYIYALKVHIFISIIAIAMGIIIGIPLAIISFKSDKISSYVMNLFNFLRIIPSLAILVLVMPLLGVGLIPALFALIVLAIPPILINTYLGFNNIDKSVIESAEGMGMNKKELLLKIQIPLALPLIVTGIRTSSIEVIASATLASYIGAGGLGDFIFKGLVLNDTKLLIVGGGTVAILSIISELILFVFQQLITRYERA